MKQFSKKSISLLSFFFILLLSNSGFAKSREYYQIQVYRLNGKAQEEKVDNFLK